MIFKFHEHDIYWLNDEKGNVKFLEK